jgi:hypothetical protein
MEENEMMDHEGFFREWGRTTVASKRITRPGDNSDAGGSMDIWIETLYQAFKARLNEEESSMSGRITDERLDIVTNVIADGECCDIGHELELLQALKAERDQLKGAGKCIERRKSGLPNWKHR